MICIKNYKFPNHVKYLQYKITKDNTFIKIIESFLCKNLGEQAFEYAQKNHDWNIYQTTFTEIFNISLIEFQQ